jgi:hypothetical protein
VPVPPRALIPAEELGGKPVATFAEGLGCKSVTTLTPVTLEEEAIIHQFIFIIYINYNTNSLLNKQFESFFKKLTINTL